MSPSHTAAEFQPCLLETTAEWPALALDVPKLRRHTVTDNFLVCSQEHHTRYQLNPQKVTVSNSWIGLKILYNNYPLWAAAPLTTLEHVRLRWKTTTGRTKPRNTGMGTCQGPPGSTTRSTKSHPTEAQGTCQVTQRNSRHHRWANVPIRKEVMNRNINYTDWAHGSLSLDQNQFAMGFFFLSQISYLSFRGQLKHHAF